MARPTTSSNEEATVSDPQGSDRIQQDVPTASATGDNSDSASSFDDVPLTREEALDRDAAQGDDLPAGADGDVARARRAGASGEVEGPTTRSGGRDA